MKRFALLVAVVLGSCLAAPSRADAAAEMDAWYARWMDSKKRIVFDRDPTNLRQPFEASKRQAQRELQVIIRTAADWRDYSEALTVFRHFTLLPCTSR